MGILKKFLLKIIIEDAIANEEAAYKFYETAVKTVSEPESTALLKRLMAEELRHRIKLEELQKKGHLDPNALSEELHVEEQEQESFHWQEIPPGSSLQDILYFALRKEQRAASHYKRLCENTSIRTFQEVFHLLSQEESQHVSWIKNQLTQIS